MKMDSWQGKGEGGIATTEFSVVYHCEFILFYCNLCWSLLALTFQSGEN